MQRGSYPALRGYLYLKGRTEPKWEWCIHVWRPEFKMRSRHPYTTERGARQSAIRLAERFAIRIIGELVY